MIYAGMMCRKKIDAKADSSNDEQERKV